MRTQQQDGLEMGRGSRWIGLRASRVPGIEFGHLRVEIMPAQPHGHGLLGRLMDRLFQRRLWQTLDRVVVQYHGLSMVVPPGRITDFASVPRMLQWMLNERAIYSYAALAHDFLYYEGRFSRAVCDGVFLELLKAEGVGPFDRWVMYLVVRACGKSAWDRHRGLGHPTRNEGVF